MDDIISDSKLAMMVGQYEAFHIGDYNKITSDGNSLGNIHDTNLTSTYVVAFNSKSSDARITRKLTLHHTNLLSGTKPYFDRLFRYWMSKGQSELH